MYCKNIEHKIKKKKKNRLPKDKFWTWPLRARLRHKQAYMNGLLRSTTLPQNQVGPSLHVGPSRMCTSTTIYLFVYINIYIFYIYAHAVH
jgi:hypothetical protein